MRLPNDSSNVWSASQFLVANGQGASHNAKAKGCGRWPWQGTTSTHTDETARSNDTSGLKTSVRKKGSPAMQPPATPAWVEICLSCDHWKSPCLEISKTCRVSTARRPPAKFDGRVPSYVVRDTCPTEKSRYIFHTWVPGQPPNPLQQLSPNTLPFQDHWQQ